MRNLNLFRYRLVFLFTGCISESISGRLEIINVIFSLLGIISFPSFSNSLGLI